MKTENYDKIKLRLLEARKTLKMTQSELAERIGVQGSYVGTAENLKSDKGISFRLLFGLITKCNISIDWLLTGRGNMTLSPLGNNELSLVHNEAVQSLNYITRSNQLSLDDKIAFFESFEKLIELILKNC